MKKSLLFTLLCIPLLLTSCKSKGKNSESSSSQDESMNQSESMNESESSEDSETYVPPVDEDEFEKYMTNLENTSKGNHFYYHYLRYSQSQDDFNEWDVWVWPYRPNEGQGVRFDWQGRTTNPDRMSAEGNATIDSFGYVSIDVDLTKTYDGGWTASTHTMGGIETHFINDGHLVTQIGTQIVLSSSRTSASGFWKNDGGNVFLKLEDYAMKNSDGSTSYHAFVYEDHVSSPKAKPIVAASTAENPFSKDDGENVTYKKDGYNTADWVDKEIKPSSEQFLKTAGIGYQIMVASFADSDGDGFGDIYGIEQKLDYLKNLGVKVLWLTPIQKSDSYHGYDIADYLKVDAKFGSSVSPAAIKAKEVNEDTAKADYKSLIDAAHEKGMLVVMDLVLNHTSTTNNWFIDSAQLSKALRGYYQWGNNETQADDINEDNYWYPYGDHVYSYYAKFGSGMPELNYAYADTRVAVETMAKNWCKFGVDGFRMDAVKHIFLEDEIDYDSNDTYIVDLGSGINYSSDLTKNLNFWRELNYEVKKDYPNAFFVGENFDGHAYHTAPFYEGFDSLFDFYSYFNFTTIASAYYHGYQGGHGAYPGAYVASFLGNWNESSTDKFDASKELSQGDLKGNIKSFKYTNGWNLAGVLDTYNKYRTGGSSATSQTGYQMINGAFTSNHDIARAINRVAGTEYNNTGLTAQGNVEDTTYQGLLEYTTLVEILELMLPGLSWIYYGDELGMTGNFADGKDANSGYADLAYRQPMKWVQNGKVGDGSMTTGYSISGAEDSVKWDSINASTVVQSAEEQIKETNSNSHYHVLSRFANAKNADQALINGVYTPYYKDITDNTAQNSVASFTRTLGNKSYRVVANFGSSTVSLTTGGSVVASYNGATEKVVPSKSAVLIDLDGQGGGDIEGDITYTVTNLPNWIQDHGCVIYAWVWSPTSNGKWVALTINGTTASFVMDEELTGFLLVRCKEGTTQPDWSEKSDVPGRIYNQTENINCSSGVYTYNCSSWKDYNP